MTTCSVWDLDTWRPSQSAGRRAAAYRKFEDKVKETCRESYKRAATYALLEKAFLELDEILEECAEPNWDGYGALPTSKDAFKEVKDFLSLLVAEIPSVIIPEITPEVDGGLELEWYNPEGEELTLSFNGRNVITYSGIFSDNAETLGTDPFDMKLSPTIRANIQRIDI